MLSTINPLYLGLEREYKEFISLYGSAINDLWTKQFLHEDINGRGVTRYTVAQYMIAFFLAYLIKHEYSLGKLEESLPSNYNMTNIRKYLNKLGINFDLLSDNIYTTQKLFSLEVNDDDEIVDSVRNREIDSSGFTTDTQDGMSVIVPSSSVNFTITDYMDELSFVKTYSSFTPFSINIVYYINHYTASIGFYKHNNSDSTEYSVVTNNTSFGAWVNYPNNSMFRNPSGMSPSGWNIVTITVDGNSSENQIKIYHDGRHMFTYTEGPVFLEPSGEMENSLYFFMSSNKLHKLEIYKGKISEKDVIKNYLYYKNLLNL